MKAISFLDKLLAYVPQSSEEAAAQTRIVAHVRAGGSLFDRRRWDGHLTGSAFVLHADGSQLLLVHHRKLAKWLQPGGHGEARETDAAHVALREAEEETGVVGLRLHPDLPQPFDLDVHVIPARKDEPAHEHLDVRYVLVAPGDAAVRADLSEVLGARWFGLADAAGLPDGSVARVARKLQAIRCRAGARLSAS